MKLKKIVKELNLQLLHPEANLKREINDAYVSDLLSDVIANAPEGSIWITIQKHSNIIAVAVLKSLAGIILTGKITPEKETLEKAKKERIPLFSEQDNSFITAGKIYKLFSQNK